MLKNANQDWRSRRKLWAKALRSGRFKQTKGCLEDKNGNCCLGVACRVAIENGVSLTVTTNRSGETIFDGHTVYLPRKVMDWFGLATLEGEIIGRSFSLISLNDLSGKSFEGIADIIESEPQGLFVEGK